MSRVGASLTFSILCVMFRLLGFLSCKGGHLCARSSCYSLPLFTFYSLDQNPEQLVNYRSVPDFSALSVSFPSSEPKWSTSYFSATAQHNPGTNLAIVSRWEGRSHESCFALFCFLFLTPCRLFSVHSTQLPLPYEWAVITGRLE